jgi:hypothetical protein
VSCDTQALYDPAMAAAQNGNAKGGNSLDRFLIRAIIALAFLMIGVVVGFSVERFVPGKPVQPVAQDQQAMVETQPEAEPTTAGAESQAVETPPEPEPVVEPEPAADETAGDETAGDETAGDETAGDETAGDGDGEPSLEPTPGVEPPPMSGNLIVEVRDVTGEARDKNDIRNLAKQHGHEFEACIVQHGPGLEVARMHYQFYVTPNGKIAGSLLLQGVNPELDACVEKAIAGWNFGIAGENSFFKLKLVWTA